MNHERKTEADVNKNLFFIFQARGYAFNEPYQKKMCIYKGINHERNESKGG